MLGLAGQAAAAGPAAATAKHGSYQPWDVSRVGISKITVSVLKRMLYMLSR